MNRQLRTTLMILMTLTLILTSVAQAGEHHRTKHGLFLGLDMNSGGGGLEYEIDGEKFKSEENIGAGGGIRFGFAFNQYVSLAVEGRGFAYRTDDLDYALGSGLLVVTVYPAGGGFYLKLGMGAGGIVAEARDGVDPESVVEFDEEAGVGAFGLGYEWMVNPNFGLGVAWDMTGLVSDDFDDVEDLVAGSSTLGLAMNYYF